MTNTTTPQKKYELTETRRVTLDYAIMLSAPLIFAIYKNGIQALFLALVSVISCTLVAKLGEKVLNTPFSSRLLTPVVIGLSVALMLPSTAPWWIFVFTSAFAVLVCVLPFGAPEKAPFVPASVAICFAILCWKEEVFNYQSADASITELLSQNISMGDNIASVLEVLVGNIPSAMGTGCAFILFGALVFLAIRRPKDSIPVFAFLLAVIVMAILFPRVGTGRFISLVMELCGGMLLFGAIFFISVPSVMPQRTISRVVWGFTGGVICMIIRYIGAVEESACFGILITCAISDFFDKLPLTKKEKSQLAEEEIPVEIPITVVPDEVLEEIPDILEEDMVTETEVPETSAEEQEEIVVQEAETLEEVISEENTVTDQQAPFVIGGGDNE
ncbi:MAG: RnfABCDGE type electron transport complex subunit D [Clostridia bacterium]|nr:RnfABCDGE type electron transport complex subunit D [Clostridia bacterium]